jgi:small subunit ribosomal protein S8
LSQEGYDRLLSQLEVLKQEGFIRAYKPTGESAATRRLRVYLKRERRRSAITKIVRVSKPGKRLYRKAHELPRVRSGLGVAIISTSNGLMTDRSAFHRRMGGEVLCYVW